MARLRLPILATVAAAALAGSAHGQADAFKPQLDMAKQQRLAGNLGQSAQIVQGVLAKSPNNFRALYTRGLIELDQGKPSTAVTTLSSAIVNLKGQPAPDPTIYNTLGYALMNQGRLDEASQAFQKGYAVRGGLERGSQQKLLNNMSLLYRLKGDQKSAQSYLAQAAAVGSPVAQTNIARSTALAR